MKLIMIQIALYYAQVIFDVYMDRFEGMNTISDLKEGNEIHLLAGVKITKYEGLYYIKSYAFGDKDFIKFWIQLGVDVGEYLLKMDDARVAALRQRASVRTNPDGSASLTGKLVGMGF